MSKGKNGSRTFYLKRKVDETGVSGTGIQAQGFIADNGKVVIVWLSETPSTTVFDSVGDLQAVHGHGAATEVVFDPDWKRAYNELASFVSNTSLLDIANEKLPSGSEASKMLLKQQVVDQP